MPYEVERMWDGEQLSARRYADWYEALVSVGISVGTHLLRNSYVGAPSKRDYLVREIKIHYSRYVPDPLVTHVVIEYDTHGNIVEVRRAV